MKSYDERLKERNETFKRDLGNARFNVQCIFETRHDQNFTFGLFSLGLSGKRTNSYKRRRFSACRFYMRQAISTYRYLLKQNQPL